MFVVGWIILAIVVGAAATSKGRSFFGYFLLAMLLSPLIGFLVLIVVPSLKPPPATASAPSQATSGVVASRSTGKSLAFFVGFCAVIALLAGIIDGGPSTSSSSNSTKSPLSQALPTSQVSTAPSLSSSAPSPLPNRPLAGSEIKEAQQHLFDLGFDPGPRDGIAGANTIAAMRRFEAARSLTVTGMLDLRLLEGLRSQKDRTTVAPLPPVLATEPPTNTPNKAHNMLVASTPANQVKALGQIVGCSAKGVAFRWYDRSSNTAMWRVDCRDGHSEIVSIYADAEGSTKILDCSVLKAIAKTDCFN